MDKLPTDPGHVGGSRDGCTWERDHNNIVFVPIVWRRRCDTRLRWTLGRSLKVEE